MRLFLYGHYGSANHGCEAIVRATREMLGEETTLLSLNPDQDIRYGLGDLVKVTPATYGPENGYPMWILYRALFRFGLIDVARRENRNVGRGGTGAYLSIGGDNYCYGRGVETFTKLRKRLARKGNVVVLWGCSIEPALLEDAAFVDDLAEYRMIFARESITYEALLAKGLRNAVLFPDPAFVLPEEPLPGFGATRRNAVGVNLSPMAQGYERTAGITYANFRNMIRRTLETTDLDVLLIPHVVDRYGDDREPLGRLVAEFRDSGRVSLVPDCGCRALKYIIARCRFFVGARTHATIAAYSSRVPTLAVGYSVKARGIARDIFGDEACFVLPVQTLEEEDALADAFDWLRAHEGEVRERLALRMPDYVRAARAAGEALKSALGGEARG